MANTIDADILLDTLSQRVITFLGAKLAPLAAFSRDFSAEVSQTKSIQVPVITGGSTTLTNPTSFEAGDSTTSNVAVTVNHYSQPFHITSKEYNQKLALEMLADANLKTLANKISDINTALWVDANITPTNEVVAQASFAAANAKSIWGKLGLTEEKFLILDSVAYAQLAPADKNAFQLGETGAYGFDGIFHQTRFTGITANGYGIGCGREFMAVASAIPMQAPGLAKLLDGQRIVTIPGLGLSVQINLWTSAATRAQWASFDVMYGAAVAEANAAVLILSA